MTLEELRGLVQGEVVVITEVDERITEYHNFQIGDEMVFSQFGHDGVVDFFRKTIIISHFSYEICHYIERKIKLERDKKISSIGI